MPAMLITFDTSHLEISELNDDANVNMRCMLVTPDTSHFDRSPSNLVAAENKNIISVTPETSQVPIGSRGPLVQSVETSMHS